MGYAAPATGAAIATAVATAVGVPMPFTIFDNALDRWMRARFESRRYRKAHTKGLWYKAQRAWADLGHGTAPGFGSTGQRHREPQAVGAGTVDDQVGAHALG